MDGLVVGPVLGLSDGDAVGLDDGTSDGDAGGMPLIERMWNASPPQARDEYGRMLDDFVK